MFEWLQTLAVSFFSGWLGYWLASRTKKKDRELEMIKNFNGVVEYFDPSNNKYSSSSSLLWVVPDPIEARERIVKFKSDFGDLFSDKIRAMLGGVVAKINRCDAGFTPKVQKEIHSALIEIRNEIKKDC